MSSNRNSRRQYMGVSRQSYDGNAARQLDTVPVRRRQEPIPQPRRRQSRSVYYNREKAQIIDAQYVAVLTIAILAICVFSGYFLYLRSDIVKRTKEIAGSEVVLLELKTDNDVKKNELKTLMSTDYIRRVATRRLGMVLPSKRNIRTYDKQASEYMKDEGTP